MFSAIRRAWKNYIDSIPKPIEFESVSDREIAKELNPPHSQEIVDAYSELSNYIVAHLEGEIAVKTRAAIVRQLKPALEPAEALCDWISARSGPQAKNLGLLAVDWKAREEINWQIQRIAKAHAVDLAWQYEWQSDESWQSELRENEFPVEVPLKYAGNYFGKCGLSLIVIVQDDAVFGFAVSSAKEDRVREICGKLSIRLSGDT